MSNKETAAPELKVSETVLELADKIGKQLKIDDQGTAVLDKEFIEGLYPEGLKDAEKRVQDFRADIVSAAAKALGEAGNKYFKKHQDATDVRTGFALGKDSVELTYQRQKTYPSLKEGADPITKYGVISSKYTANGAVNSRGSFKKVAAYLQAVAADTLA